MIRLLSRPACLWTRRKPRSDPCVLALDAGGLLRGVGVLGLGFTLGFKV